MIIKVCGMRDAENIREVERCNPDMMGFIFWDGTKRNVTTIPRYLPTRCKRVGVFVNAETDFIMQHVKDYALDAVQLHGNETPQYCEALKKEIPDTQLFKAISISDDTDITHAMDYEGLVDFFVFDTKCKCVGGSGEQFDWDILQVYHGTTPFLLSGGIGPDDADRINDFQHPGMTGIDLNSRFELSPAMKNVKKINEFIKEIRQ